MVYSVHLHRIHKRFYNEFETKPAELKDTKFYIRKLKGEMFSCSKMVSFEVLIPNERDVERSFEGESCNQLNLIRVSDLANKITENIELAPILLVPDDINTSELKNLQEKYPEGTIFISALWFYFSVFFTYELPLEPFKLNFN